MVDVAAVSVNSVRPAGGLASQAGFLCYLSQPVCLSLRPSLRPHSPKLGCSLMMFSGVIWVWLQPRLVLLEPGDRDRCTELVRSRLGHTSLAANFVCDSEGGAGLEMLTREEAKAGRGEVTSAPCQAPNWLHTDPHVAAVAWSLSVSLSSDVTGGSGRGPYLLHSRSPSIPAPWDSVP